MSQKPSDQVRKKGPRKHGNGAQLVASKSRYRSQYTSTNEAEVIELFTTDEESEITTSPQRSTVPAVSEPALTSSTTSYASSIDGIHESELSQTKDVLYISSDDSNATGLHEKDEAFRTMTPRARRISHPVDLDYINLISDSDSDKKEGFEASSALPSAQMAINAISGESLLDDFLWGQNDGSILVFDEPKSARKPIRTPKPKSNSTAKTTSKTVSRVRALFEDVETSDASDSSTTKRETGVRKRGRKAPAQPSVSLKILDEENPPPLVASQAASKGNKKLSAAAEQTRREEYASKLFEDLNRTVFSDGLPKNTKLVWSKRLLTTAGRANWHRSRAGVDSVEIELATKIIDSDERIRNTLSHEMCHLASWLISDSPKEHHGSIFKSWASKVMRKRPEISVTTRHNYDISYKYEWKCDSCSKIYGRHSKSIKPEECRCGACKIGKLIPLFKTRVARTIKTETTTNDISPHDLSQATHTTLESSILDEITHAINALDVGAS